METRVIPPTRIVTCDVCGEETPPHGSAVRKQVGQLIVSHDSLNYLENPAASNETAFDLCDFCLGLCLCLVTTAINAAVDGARKSRNVTGASHEEAAEDEAARSGRDQEAAGTEP